MDVESRRALLRFSKNPTDTDDYLVSLGGLLKVQDHGTFNVRVTYVPDALLLDVSSLHYYLRTLSHSPAITPEQSGKTLLEDANNELVPRWIRITLISRPEGEKVGSYRCLFQDSQPNWSNSELTAAVVEFETA